MKYTSMSNAIHEVLNPVVEVAVEAEVFTPIVEEVVEVPVEEIDEDTTIETPLAIRGDPEAVMDDRARMKMHLKLSLRRQRQNKIIDNV